MVCKLIVYFPEHPAHTLLSGKECLHQRAVQNIIIGLKKLEQTLVVFILLGREAAGHTLGTKRIESLVEGFISFQIIQGLFIFFIFLGPAD